MLADVMAVVTKVYLPIFTPFLFLLMALLFSERLIDVIKGVMGR